MIDIIFLMLVALAIYKGLQKGFIIAVFSLVGFIIGLAAAIKLSAVVAVKLAEHTGAGKWLPALSFLIVFLGVVFLIHVTAKLIEKTFETVLLGWLNKLAGIFLYLLLYSIIFSVLLFYAVQLHFVNDVTIKASIFYPYLAPLGPKVIGSIGIILPWFKDTFTALEHFFEGVSTKFP